MKEIRIPHDGLTDEGFIALKAQMRILFGVPVEVLPHSRSDLFHALQAAPKSAYPLCRWLAANGYEVLQPKLGAYYVIRQADFETLLWEGVAKRITTNIDRHVLTGLYGKLGV